MADARPIPITPPYVPIVDPTTGQMHRAWYMFFLSLLQTAEVGSDWDKAPQASDTSGEISQAAQSAQLAALMRAEFGNELQAAQLSAQLGATQAQLAELQNLVQGLAVAPPRREFKRSRYGSFYDTTTQTAAVINTAYPVTLNTTDLSWGVRLRSPSTSEVEVDTEGIYDIQFSAQLDNTSGGNHTANIWLRVNGVDVPNSAGRLVLKGTDGDLVASWNYFQQFKAGDYFQVMWSVSDTAVQLVTAAAAAPVPAIPSVILTVSNNIQGVQ